ncbi:MAG TPA: type II toxin-antitoxin system VapC family toxin [Kiritimatiellia bacterium]|mgnify:FL=1|nr:type II toxin-antitoxin system VapC family toxin [Kiritimatiellia bacterium]HMO97954.1 type II toxin-antitoxin system VapC family toxin [Kiritimatiellia bacterium]HMP95305.1 type II toxin-antitoxin system VapC family toxin [Kiritimatiellia bacterium]
MVVYADTSFLVSLYSRDANSGPAQKMASGLSAPLAFTPFLRHESRNALRLAVFRKEITPAECQSVLAALEADVKAGSLVETPVSWAEVYTEAEALSAAHTAKLGVRASDVLHVAAAIALGAREFYTFDTRQKTLAVKAGMKVKP